MLVLTCDLGPDVCTGIIPVVAAMAKELGIYTITVVTLPINWGNVENAHYKEALK